MISRFYFILSFITAISSVLAQEAPNLTDASGKKQGHWIKLDVDKKKIYEGTFRDNYPVGKFSYFFDTGVPWSVAHFSEKGKIARTQMFNAAGKLIAEGKYVNEKKDSLWKFYTEDGFLLAEEIYTLGVKNGPSKVFYTNGQLAEEKNYKSGKIDGPCRKYFESGQPKYVGQYIADKVEGKAFYYFPSGKVNAEGVYKNDLKDGPWKYYKEDGTVDRTDVYVAGRMINNNKDFISKEEQEQEKKKFEQFELKDPYQENYHPE